MSNFTQQQHQDSIKSTVITCKTFKQQEQFIIESSASLNNTMLRRDNMNDKEDSLFNQEIIATAVSVNLYDCLKCYVKIPQLQIDQHSSEIQSKIQIEVGQDIQELQEEQEKALVQQRNEMWSEEETNVLRRGSYYVDLYLEDFNPMNTAIIIDLPWPQSLE